jgi:hypothetical protein
LAVKGRGGVRLYLCWAHREYDPPEAERTVSVQQMLSDDFRLTYGEVLTINAIVGPRRRRTTA